MVISIIGGGAMGSALAQGLVRNGLDKDIEIIVSNPHIEKIKPLEASGLRITDSNIEATRPADILIIAVKPWKVKDVIEEITSSINPKIEEIAFIVAGIPGEELITMFNGAEKGDISIVMPNTAMAKGKSMTFMVPLQGNSEKTKLLFEKVGKVEVIEERLLPAATALASCGIAYGLRYVRAATEGGVELGFKAQEAQKIVAQTLAGVVALLDSPDAHAEEEIDKVTTPGGITIKGLNAMEKEGFTNAVIQGLKASRK